MLSRRFCLARHGMVAIQARSGTEQLLDRDSMLRRVYFGLVGRGIEVSGGHVSFINCLL
jgi:hypothetical protein